MNFVDEQELKDVPCQLHDRELGGTAYLEEDLPKEVLPTRPDPMGVHSSMNSREQRTVQPSTTSVHQFRIPIKTQKPLYRPASLRDKLG
jgi:hypothetical protein